LPAIGVTGRYWPSKPSTSSPCAPPLSVEGALRLLQQLRHRLAALLDLGAHEVEAEHVHDAERAGVVAVAPLHRAVDARDVVGERRRGGQRVERRVDHRRAQEVAVLAGQSLDGGEALGERRARGRLELGRLEALLRAVLVGARIPGVDVLADLLVEAAARLVAQPLLGHHLLEPGGEREGLARGLREAARHVHQHVDARQVAGAEGRRLGAAEQRTGEAVDLVDREAELLHARDRAVHAEHAEAVGDEARRVLAEHRALAEQRLAERAHRVEHGGVGLGRRDQLQQVHVARWREEVHAEELAPEALGASLRQHRHRDARRVGGDDRRRPEHGLQLLVERLLGARLLDDRLDRRDRSRRAAPGRPRCCRCG
jgi:hypothetical protein